MKENENAERSACMNAAYAILALSDEVGGASWDYMMNEEGPFLWVDFCEGTDTITERWNEIVGDGTSLVLEATSGSSPEGHSEAFVYGGKMLCIPFEYQRGDAMIAVVTLNQLVKENSELRFCLASSGSSEVAFIPLPPSAWRQLESEFGSDTVAKRFRPLTADAYESGLL